MYNLWDEAKRDTRKGNNSSDPSGFETDCGSSRLDYDCDYSYDYDSEDEGRECENPYTGNLAKERNSEAAKKTYNKLYFLPMFIIDSQIYATALEDVQNTSPEKEKQLWKKQGLSTQFYLNDDKMFNKRDNTTIWHTRNNL